MAHRFGCLLPGLAGLVLAAQVQGVAAQGLPLPGPAEPGIEQRERDLPTPRPSPGIEIPAPGIDAEAPAGADQVTLVLEQLIVDGATAYTVDELQNIYADRLGRQITLADIFSIAAEITRRYRDDGFVLSRALVPAQTIDNGIVRITVVEGFIGTVTVDDPDGSDDRTRRLITGFGQRIRAATPLDIATLERYLLLANDLAGVTAEGILTPSNDLLGASDLIIAVTRDRLDGFVNADNRGSKFVGPIRIQGGATVNGVLGLAERTGGRLIVTSDTDELRFAELLHEQPVGLEGLTLGVRTTVTRSEPGSSLAALDVENKTEAVELTATFPLIRSRRRNLLLDGEFFYYNAESDLLSQAFTEDRTRALRFGATLDTIDSFLDVGVNILRFEVSQGLNVLGARESGSANLSRAAGRSDFTKLNLEGSRLQSLTPRFNLLVAAAGQYAADPLLAVEEFCLGGRTFGRAYDSCEVAGDHGLTGRVELQFIPPLPETNLRAQFFTYYDMGAVWNRDSGAGTAARQSLASAGLGLRLNFAEHLSGEFEVAKPLTRKVGAEGNDDTRFFFDLVARF